MPTVTTEYIGIGGNRHSAAADWSSHNGILAFGADHNIALWRPCDGEGHGIYALLRAHKAKVTAVKFLQTQNESGHESLLSGDADGEVRVFKVDAGGDVPHSESSMKAHDGAVTCIAVLERGQIFATGGADATIKLWRWQEATGLQNISTITTKPRHIPLCLALGDFGRVEASDAVFVAAGGTKNDVTIYTVDHISSEPQVIVAASSRGHEGWVRSLSLVSLSNGDQLLASGSADKYVRLWRFGKGEASSASRRLSLSDSTADQSALSAKIQKVSAQGAEYSFTFEALLFGHDDWIYSTAWTNKDDNLRLLTASADGTLSIWEPDQASGIWVSSVRLGEISGQKGATTATGSSGGFFNALWSPNGRAVACLGRTGSWRLWQYDDVLQYWIPKHAVNGHVGSVNSIAWSPNGSCLLSTSSDQTTRLHGEWRRGTKRSWHEFARPQIHGYDLNCVTCTKSDQFVSGADEKLLRVFDKPRSLATMLKKLCGIDPSDAADLPESAAIPVLGLSNKALDDSNGVQEQDADADYRMTSLETSVEGLEEPPTEDLLSRHTLWPEKEKLYGHGYEISEAAASESGAILATACKASSLDHAMIRLYDTQTWNEIKPPLTAHTLTVTRLVWSPAPHEYLLSVGRDRQWAVFTSFETEQGKEWKLMQWNPKAHTRMILDAAFSSLNDRPFFVTAGRDKSVKLWSLADTQFTLVQTITRTSPVTAVALTRHQHAETACLAVGQDDGNVAMFELEFQNELTIIGSHEIRDSSSELPVCKAVNRLAWRPQHPNYQSDGPGLQLAIAGADGSVRILRIDTEGAESEIRHS